MAGVLELDDVRGTFQPEPSHDSVIYSNAMEDLKGSKDSRV